MARNPTLTELLSSPTSRRRFLAGTATVAIALGLQQSAGRDDRASAVSG